MVAQVHWVSEYFHVVVSTSDGKLKALFTDLTRQQLNKKFVRPYKKSLKLIHESEVIDLSTLSAVHIIRTTNSKEDALKDLQIASRKEIDDFNRSSNWATWISAGYGGADEDLVYCSDNVTDQFIQAIEPTILQSVMNHPWVVAIATGLIVGLVILVITIAVS